MLTDIYRDFTDDELLNERVDLKQRIQADRSDAIRYPTLYAAAYKRTRRQFKIVNRMIRKRGLQFASTVEKPETPFDYKPYMVECNKCFRLFETDRAASQWIRKYNLNITGSVNREVLIHKWDEDTSDWKMIHRRKPYEYLDW